MGRARWKSRTEDWGVGCYPIRASNDFSLNDFSFEAEEAAIAEAARGINPLDSTRVGSEFLVVSRALPHQSQRLVSHKVCGVQQRFVDKCR